MTARFIKSYRVLALVFVASFLRSDCIIRNYPRHRALINSGFISFVNGIAKIAPRTFKSFSSYQDSAGSDSLGFSTSLQKKSFVLPSQVIFGSNAIEHGINLIEEKTHNVLLVSGWNSARLDPILWEMEPRGFELETCCIKDEPTVDAVHSVVAAALASNCGAIIAMGCGSVIDTAKMATTLINSHKDAQSLAEMSSSQLGASLLSKSTSDITEPLLGTVLLVTIPALPSMGAELSAVAALRHEIYTASSLDSNDVSTGDCLSDPLSVPQQQLKRSKRVSKSYVHTQPPDLCLIQPSLTYRAPMELVHDRLLGLISTSIDIILSDPGKSHSPLPTPLHIVEESSNDPSQT
jgi:Iron-containing alcohol dehydrogenase